MSPQIFYIHVFIEFICSFCQHGIDVFVLVYLSEFPWHNDHVVKIVKIDTRPDIKTDTVRLFYCSEMSPGHILYIDISDWLEVVTVHHTLWNQNKSSNKDVAEKPLTYFGKKKIQILTYAALREIKYMGAITISLLKSYPSNL